jgi:hypothetical protein
LPTTHTCFWPYPLITQTPTHTPNTRARAARQRPLLLELSFLLPLQWQLWSPQGFFGIFHLRHTNDFSICPLRQRPLPNLELSFVLPLQRQLWSPQGFFCISLLWHTDDFGISPLSNTEVVCPNFSSFLCKIWFLWEYFLGFLLFMGILNASNY